MTGEADEAIVDQNGEQVTAVTVLGLAYERGLPNDGTPLNGDQFASVNLPMWGGCEGCGASIAAYNAYPSKSGYLRCKDCIGDFGWTDVKECNQALFPHEFERERAACEHRYVEAMNYGDERGDVECEKCGAFWKRVP